MTDATRQPDLDRIRIEPARPEDRATLAMTNPNMRYMAESGWSLVAVDGNEEFAPVVGSIVVTKGYVESELACLGMHLSIVSSWLETDLADLLLQPVIESTVEWGARRLRTTEHLQPDAPLGRKLEEHGFIPGETFDTYEMDLEETIESWKDTLERIERNLKFPEDIEIVPLQEHMAMEIARAWAAFIGGDAEQNRDTIIRAIAGLESLIDANHSRVAIRNGRVIGLHLCKLRDTTLKVHALAIHPRHRLSGLQLRLFIDNGVRAFKAGALVQQYEAGRRQPDTRNMSKRIKARLINSAICYERELGENDRREAQPR